MFVIMAVATHTRAVGVALVSGSWTDFWIYLAGPIIGAAAGAFAYQLVRGGQLERSQTTTTESERDGAPPVRLPP